MSLAAVLLNGCGFWDSSVSSSVTSTTLSSGYFYILDPATSQIIVYDIVSGTLTQVGSYATPSAPLAIASAPNNAFLVVSTTSGIYAYAVSGGALTLDSSPLSSDPAVAIKVDADSEWLLETSGNGFLDAIPVLNTSGAFDPSRSTAKVALPGNAVHQIAVSPNDQFAFVASDSNGTYAYSFAPSHADPFGSAAYAHISPANTAAGAALAVAVDTSTRMLYIGESAAVSSSDGGLRAFTIASNGALSEIPGSPMSSGGSGPDAILPKSTGDYVYVANWSGTSNGNITGFSITNSNSTFLLKTLSPAVATGVEPMSLAEDSNGNFVLAVSAQGNPYFDAYYFDTSTSGLLDTTITSSSVVASSLAAQR